MPRISERVRKFLEGLSFTTTERNVVISLVGAFLVGLAIQLFRQSGSESPTFDYSVADSVFATRSAFHVPGAGPDSGGLAALPARGGDKKPATPLSVNINTAGKREFMALPGVGETLADRILRYRMDHGRFTSVRDLLGVKGIGKKKLEHLAPFCVVEN